MSESDIASGVWFVYDGACPICNYAAQALRIKARYGELHLLNARDTSDHALINLINTQGLDLDEGMVIYCERRLYHGASALHFMAKFGDGEGPFNFANKALFWSDGISVLVYPLMRHARNAMLKVLGKSKIDNLNLKNSPIFQEIFGPAWEGLPKVLKKHYANRPYSTDRVTVEGLLDVSCRSYMRFLRPFYRVLGSLPAVTENNVPVTVNFDSAPDTKAFHFKRVFNFADTMPYHFKSRMLQVSENEVVEIMRFGVCWRMTYSWDGKKVRLRHKGYALKIFGYYLPLPITPLLGRGEADETAVDDDHFDMNVTITHPLFGVVYSYAGSFKVIQQA